MTEAVFVFLLTLRAFDGVTVTVEAPTLAACRQARIAVRKQLMLAGVPYTLTDCAQK